MRKLSLEETWDYTKRMWKWIAIQKEIEEVKRTVSELKKVWLEENAPEFLGMTSNCFFCYGHSGSCEETCPGSLVAGSWSCCDSAHNYCAKPGAFYREILRLDAIRTAEPVEPEHEWKHGDVFKNRTATVMILIQNYNAKQRKVYCLDTCNLDHPNVDEYLDGATFLWNIKSKL